LDKEPAFKAKGFGLVTLDVPISDHNAVQLKFYQTHSRP